MSEREKVEKAQAAYDAAWAALDLALKTPGVPCSAALATLKEAEEAMNSAIANAIARIFWSSDDGTDAVRSFGLDFVSNSDWSWRYAEANGWQLVPHLRERGFDI